jgi:transcriptional regulator with XRE-family HTH domain
VPNRKTPWTQPGSQETPLQRLGATIRQYRKQQGFSQKVLAARTGLNYAYISGIERGQRNASVLSLLRIATALDLPLSHLLAPLDAYQASIDLPEQEHL